MAAKTVYMDGIVSARTFKTKKGSGYKLEIQTATNPHELNTALHNAAEAILRAVRGPEVQVSLFESVGLVGAPAPQPSAMRRVS